MAAAAAPDPYEELSIPRSATADQIRRAYKRACLRWHPDKHPAGTARQDAERRFKAVVRAYTLLSDPATRATYDASTPSTPPPDPFADPSYRRAFASRFAAQFAAEGHSVDAETLFESLFGSAQRAAFDSAAARAQVKPPDREVDLPLTLEELHAGCVKKRRLRRASAVQGDDAAPAVLSIAVRPGYRPGDRVRFRDAMYETPNAPPADVVFVLSQKPHDRFVTSGDDLHLTMRVRLVDALAGAVLIVRALDGADVKVRVDAVIYPGYVHVVRGQGLPRRACPEERGDLHIAFDIAFPKRVEADDRSAVRELFARLDAHANCRMAIRRSSSLFMNRGAAANILHPRRNSTSAATAAAAAKPASFPDGKQDAAANCADTTADGSQENCKEENHEQEDVPAKAAEPEPAPNKTRINKTKFRLTSIFR